MCPLRHKTIYNYPNIFYICCNLFIRQNCFKAVKRDSSDQQITSEGQTGTNTEQAQEEYRKRGMTKVDSEAYQENQNSSKTY